MKLERLQLRGFSSAFPNPVDLDLRTLGPGLIAITGANGTGKTTLLEATPGAIYRQLPARDGEDPVTYATGRDSFLDLEYAIDGVGAFHVRLNLDGPKRQTDAVLEAIRADGSRVPLNDGKRSTYDALVKERFPSFDLFINSSFAGQGRGDEFTRRKPSQRKDLFVEFLALGHLATMAKTAAEAADLLGDARLRLEVQVETLARETAPAIVQALHDQANTLQAQSAAADVRQVEVRRRLADLETRTALVADQVAAYTVATQRVRTVDAEIATRRGELRAFERQREQALQACLDEHVRVIAKRDTDLADLTKRIAGNEQIQGQASAIRAAVAAIATIDGQLGDARQQLETRQAEQVRAVTDLRAVEQQLARLVPVEQDLARAQTDANLLLDVPCGGEGAYAACRFLVNAKAAEAQIAALARDLRPKADLADRVGALTRASDALTPTIVDLRRRIAGLEADRHQHAKQAAYEAALAAADARIVELTAQRVTVTADAETQVQAADRRRTERIAEIEKQAIDVELTIGRLEADRSTAQQDLDAATTGNRQAVTLQAELAAARAEWDLVTATLATIAGSRQELAQRRADDAAKRTQHADRAARLGRVDQELLEWRDLAKALGKGGLPDLEIDAAGPAISAQVDALLHASYGPRFSLELVTQVEKVGGGMKEEFTVRVLDNQAGGGWRDLRQLSGGEKTIVQEALMCAISLYVNQRSPFPIRTLWRDETGAALDPVNAIAYVQMLRKVRELGGYHQIFFISHNAAAAALADAQIRVADGTAMIVYPPFSDERAA